MNKNNKNNKVIILLIVGVILLVSFLIFILNYSKDDSSLSILEKKWVNDNKNKVMDVSVFNDVPIYGLNGNGIIFKFLDYFSETHGITFNKISYLSSEKSNLKQIRFDIKPKKYKLTNNDILIYTDKYVLISFDNKVIDNISEIDNKKIGVFNDDISTISYYLSNSNNTSYQPFDSIDNMVISLKNKEIDYMAIPSIMYSDDILSNSFTIVYHIDELYKQYVLSIEDKNLLGIMKKAINVYNKERLTKDFNEEFLSVFYTSKNITQEDIQNYKTYSYNYGYVINMPFENVIDNEHVGIISNYIKDFEQISGIDFKLINYDNIKEIREDFSKGELDVIFANYKLKNLNIDIYETISPVEEKYVILSKNNIVANSIKSFENYEINVIKNTYLYDMLKENKIKTKDYNNSDELIRNIKNDTIIIIDYQTYNYYKESKFKDFNIIYEDTINNDYRFIIKDINKNKIFMELFDYYISTVNYKEIQNKYNTDYVISSSTLYSLLLKISIIVVTLVIIGLFILKGLKKGKKKSKITKEDKLKYIDTMTSLKNRNYLNYNIAKWDENVIYPQAIVVIDLNNIKYINDNFGHEEGDKVIKKAANILIVNQKEKTDIIRTDGNEFLIYMVGYSEQEVINFNRKVIKELKELPYEFGATLGYSMITDDLKTIDDAINEATLLMREAKEKL